MTIMHRRDPGLPALLHRCRELGVPTTDEDGAPLDPAALRTNLKEIQEKYSIPEDFTWQVSDSASWPFTPPLHVMARLLEENPNAVWSIETGHIVNTLEEALEQLYGDPDQELAHPPRTEHTPTLAELKELWMSRNRRTGGIYANAVEKIEYELGFDALIARLTRR